MIGEYPTPMPQGVVYYFHKYRLGNEARPFRAAMSEQVQRSHCTRSMATSGATRDPAVAHSLWQEAMQQRNAEIQRLHTVYGDAIQRTQAMRKGQLNALASMSAVSPADSGSKGCVPVLQLLRARGARSEKGLLARLPRCCWHRYGA